MKVQKSAKLTSIRAAFESERNTGKPFSLLVIELTEVSEHSLNVFSVGEAI